MACGLSRIKYASRKYLFTEDKYLIIPYIDHANLPLSWCLWLERRINSGSMSVFWLLSSIVKTTCGADLLGEPFRLFFVIMLFASSELNIVSFGFCLCFSCVPSIASRNCTIKEIISDEIWSYNISTNVFFRTLRTFSIVHFFGKNCTLPP